MDGVGSGCRPRGEKARELPSDNAAEKREPLLPVIYIPVRPGRLLGPSDKLGKVMCIGLSVVDEHIPWAGARPENGDSLLDQVSSGPCTWSMLLSCTFCFLAPAAVHLCMCEGWQDIFAGLALVLVSMSSSLCDAFCVHSGVYDAGPGYEKAAAAVGREAEWVRRRIQETQAGQEVLCTDYWNNLSRTIDRTTCVLVVVPAVLTFALWRRPGLSRLLPFAGGFLAAWIVCAVDQSYRQVFPCGARREPGGQWQFEDSLVVHMRLHELWHWLLFVVLMANALYRPES